MSISGLPDDIFNARYMSSIFSTAVGALVTCAVFLFFRSKQNIRLSCLDIAIFIFLCCYWMNSSAWDSIYNIGYACLIMFYCAVKCTPVLRLNILYWACLCSLSFLSVWGYLQLCRFLPSPNPYFKVTGPFYHPTYLGLTLSALMCIVIHVIMFHILHRKYTKGLFIMESVCLLSAIPILIYTESRTAWFALIMSVILPYATRQIWGKYSIRKKCWW